mgnify:CR=1 FL=1
MQLIEYEQKMLSGEYGEPKRKAMEILVALGDSFRARNMVEVKDVHLVGASIIVTGEAGVKFVENMHCQGGSFCTKTTTNPEALNRHTI